MHRILAVATNVLLAACTGDPIGPAAQRELDAAMRRWEQLAVTSYTYEVRQSCFCSPELNVWHRVHVVGGVPVSATPLEPLPQWLEPMLAAHHWPTVDRLFEAIRNNRSSDHIKRIAAEYDHELGYPRSIDIQCHAYIADCGVVYEARNLQPATGS